MKSKTMLAIATATVAVAVLGGAAVSAQDKYSLKVPGGLVFSEFRGYEDWAVVAVARTEDLLKVVVANPVAMEWKQKKSTTAPYDINVPSTVYDVDFMVKDGKRFADSGGWGYAVFVYDVASDTYKPGTLADQPPQGNDAKCGLACHTIVKGKDYVFTEYAKRL